MIGMLGKWMKHARIHGLTQPMGDAREIRLEALNDPDLEPLWKQIGEI
jgi:hypothetical protein